LTKDEQTALSALLHDLGFTRRGANWELQGFSAVLIDEHEALALQDIETAKQYVLEKFDALFEHQRLAYEEKRRRILREVMPSRSVVGFSFE
jgi:hypothetical protein